MNIENLCLNCFAERRPESSCDQCGWLGKTAADVDGQLRPGTVLHNRYVVGQPLGRGGFSITYRGWDSRLQRLRAIKEYFPAGVVTREGSQSRVSIVSGQGGLYTDGIHKYLAEARVLARFEGHPCIVFPTDFFEENATAYLVMEYLQGETLRQYVTRNGGHIPYEHAVYYLMPVLRALSAVHAEGLLHRDVSPDNVFLTTDNETKLLDFGAARQSIGGQSAAMTVIIRDHYAPPEQYSDKEKQGGWTDIYAFAATFYFALTGESPPSALSRLMNDELRRPSELGATLPLGAEAILMRALAIQPKDRPQRVEELMYTLLAPPQPVVASAAPAPLEPLPSVEERPPVAAPPPEPVLPVEPSPPVEARAVAPEPRPFTRPSRTLQEVQVVAASVLRRALDLAREEQWWRWPVFALVAVAVAFASYWSLEQLAPARPDGPPRPAVESSAPSEGAPPIPEVAAGLTDPTDAEPSLPPAAEGPAPVAPVPGDTAGETVAELETAALPAGPPPAPVVQPTPKRPTAPAPKPSSAPSAETPGLSPARPTRPDENQAVYQQGRELVRSTSRADRKRGYEFIVYAAERGLPEAELLLGSLYVDGVPGVQKADEASALMWYRKAAQRGDRQARYDLARRLELGMWEKKIEYAEPCKWWVPFCKADLPDVQVKVSVDPEKDLLAWLRSQSPGKGTRAELTEALALYKGLAADGRSEAQERIGYMLVSGNGIEANRFEAFLWFLRSARKGNPSAQYVVGKMYSKGEGIAVNEEAAVCWLRRAAAAGVGPARRALVSLGKAKPTGDLEPAPRECRYKPFEDE